MSATEIRPRDERRHAPGPGRDWEESWYLDFVAADGSLAGYVRLGLHPAGGQAWFWAGVVGGGPTLVSVRDHEVPLPSGHGLEVRASGLWTELVCETPLDHWSVGLEAFGVALDDPLEAWRAERGDPWALGLDVEWEGLGDCHPTTGGYEQPCMVHGDVLVGAERFQLGAAGGVRRHLWGARSWHEPAWWATGGLADGARFSVEGQDEGPIGVDGDGLLRSGPIQIGGGLDLTATAVAHSPVLIPGAGGLARALCRYEAADGRYGFGWAERFHPGPTH